MIRVTRMVQRSAVVAAALASTFVAARATATEPLEQTIASVLRRDDVEGCFRYAEVELDDRPPAEIVVLLLGPALCGTGGCTAVVYRRAGGALDEISSIPLVDELRISRSTTRGWHDLFVKNREGSWLLQFDGSTYPENPTVAPAKRAQVPSQARGVSWRESSSCD